MSDYSDFLIQCNNPEAFDKTIQQLGPAVLIEDGGKGKYLMREGHYVMRVFGNAGFIKFAVEHQGYGKIIKPLPHVNR